MARTPLIIVVRNGNPRNILAFEHLARNGIELLHGDPATSGAAYLAILAEYGSALRAGGNPEKAFQQLLDIWNNVAEQAPNAREARNRFEKGVGDALITYEQDAIGSPARGRILGEIMYPRNTIIVEPVVVKVERNIQGEQRPLIDAFVEFLWSREAQQILVEYGFHSVYEDLNVLRPELTSVEDPITLSDLGGASARLAILEQVWRGRVLPQLHRGTIDPSQGER